MAKKRRHWPASEDISLLYLTLPYLTYVTKECICCASSWLMVQWLN